MSNDSKANGLIYNRDCFVSGFPATRTSVTSKQKNMNISSIAVKAKPVLVEDLVESFKAADWCDYHHHDGSNIILTIEGVDVSEEMGKVRRIERMTGVITATMIYSYCEDELDAERDKLNAETELPDWLNDENAKAEDVKYNGDFRKRMI